MSEKKISFSNPPLTEVVCGIQFQPLEKLMSVHIGELFKHYQDRFPVVKEQQALSTPLELLPDLPNPTVIKVSLAPILPRSIFVADGANAVVQIQRDAFYFNWRRSESEHYPRYEVVMERFIDEFRVLADFIKTKDLGDIEPIQFELSYVNEIPDDTDQIPILRDVQWKRDIEREVPESISLGGSFLLNNSQGRLRSFFVSAVKDGAMFYQWTLTARGSTNPRTDMSLERMRQWMDNANKWIVDRFVELSSDEAQAKMWERE